jgi:hypothetical protein
MKHSNRIPQSNSPKSASNQPPKLSKDLRDEIEDLSPEEVKDLANRMENHVIEIRQHLQWYFGMSAAGITN